MKKQVKFVKLTPEEIAKQLEELDLKLVNKRTFMDIPDFFLPGEGRPEELPEKDLDMGLLAG